MTLANLPSSPPSKIDKKIRKHRLDRANLLKLNRLFLCLDLGRATLQNKKVRNWLSPALAFDVVSYLLTVLIGGVGWRGWLGLTAVSLIIRYAPKSILNLCRRVSRVLGIEHPTDRQSNPGVNSEALGLKSDELHSRQVAR